MCFNVLTNMYLVIYVYLLWFIECEKSSIKVEIRVKIGGWRTSRLSEELRGTLDLGWSSSLKFMLGMMDIQIEWEVMRRFGFNNSHQAWSMLYLCCGRSILTWVCDFSAKNIMICWLPSNFKIFPTMDIDHLKSQILQ